LLYGHGISVEGEILDAGVQQGIVEKSGTWFHYGETRLGQGRDNARKFLGENGDLRDRIERQIRARLGIPTGTETPAMPPGRATGFNRKSTVA